MLCSDWKLGLCAADTDIPGVHEALTLLQSPPVWMQWRFDCTYFAPHIPAMPHLLVNGHTPQWPHGIILQNKSPPTPSPSRQCNHGWRIFWPSHIYICMWTGARLGEGGGPLDWRLLNWTFQTQHSIFQFASNILYFCGNTRMEALYSNKHTHSHTRFTNIPSLYSNRK